MDAELNSTERLLAALRDGIISGKLPGGSRLVEQDLAEEFGISRVPVRDAIHALIIEGLVDRLPRHGGRVHQMTRSDVADISELHEVFDVLAVRIAAVRRSPQDLDVFREDVALARAATDRGEVTALQRAGVRFRQHAYEATGNRALQEVHDALLSRTKRMFALADAQLSTPIAFYERFLQAFEQQDPDGAEAAMRELGQHFAQARQARALTELASGAFVLSVSEAEALQPPIGAYTPESVAVRNRLREEIISGVRPPGSVVSERKLSDEFQVSRGPARRAIEDLTFEGLIELGSSRKSSRVRAMSEEEQSDLFDVASALDVLATRLAAQRPSVDDLAQLHRLLCAEQQAALRGSDDVLEHAFAFRRQTYAMAGNRLILEVNRMFESRMRIMVSNAPLAQVVLQGHRLLYEAIAARDNTLAELVYRDVFIRADHRGEILANAPKE